VTAQNNAHAKVPRLLYNIPQKLARARIHAGRRLVQDNNAGLAKKRNGRAQLSLIAPAQILHQTPLELVQLKHIQHVVHNLLRRVRAAQLGEKCQRLIHSQILGQLVKLRTVSEVFARQKLSRAYTVAVDEHIANIWLTFARDYLECAGFAGAIKA